MTSLLTRVVVLVSLLLGLTACTPSLSPLYRDYAAPPASHSAIHDSIRTALRTAGWSLADEAARGVVATEAKTMQQWGLYRIEVNLEALPMGGGHVRLLIHPYRRYITGYRSKISYLPGGVRRALLPELNEAFQQQGLKVLQTPRERDRQVTAR